MSIYGNSIIIDVGSAELNITYGISPPEDTNKLWVPLENPPANVSCYYSQETIVSLQKNELFVNLGGASNKWQPVRGINLYVNVNSVSIGDENNNPESIDAYLYSIEENNWISLAGQSFAAVKLQNTLYITQSYTATKDSNNLTIQ